MTPTPRPRKLLFLCTGNLCRSVMAEHLMRSLAAQRGLKITAKSCGLAADRHFPVPSGVRKALRGAGIAELEHVPQPLTAELLSWSDVTLAMTRAHRETVLERFPEFRAKVVVLRAHAGLPDQDIDDPMGLSDEVYAACRDKIREALEALIHKHEHAESAGS